MRNIRIAIIMKDEDYAEALAHSLARNVKGLVIDVLEEKEVSDTDRDEAGDGAVDHDFDDHDVILTDITEHDFCGYSGGDPKVIFLSERPQEGCICKYAGVRVIADEILRVTGEGNEAGPGPVADDIRFGSETDIYMFVSSEGGSGCSSAAYGFAEASSLTMKKRVLYIDTAPLPGPFVHFTSDKAPDVGDAAVRTVAVRKLLFHINEGKDMSGSLDRYLHSDGAGPYSFAFEAGLSPFADMTEKLFEALLGTITRSGLFDCVVIDAGSHLSKAVLSCFRTARYVFDVRDERRGTALDGEGGDEKERFAAVEISSIAGRVEGAAGTTEGAVAIHNFSGEDVRSPGDRVKRPETADTESPSGRAISIPFIQGSGKLTENRQFIKVMDALAEAFG